MPISFASKLVLVACLWASAALSQEISVAHCNKLLEHGINEVTETSSDYFALSSLQERYCSTEYEKLSESSKKQFAIEVPQYFKASGKGDGGNDAESYKKL